MDWLSANWVWILIAVAFAAMHLFAHGGHGGHGGHSEDERRSSREPSDKREDDKSVGHRH